MKLLHLTLGALLAATSIAAIAQPAPRPGAMAPMAMPSTAAMPFMKMAGEGDVFEITSSSVALTKSQNPRVQEYAAMMIDHHTKTTNVLLTQAKAAQMTPPPAVLSPPKIALIDALFAAAPADFDRTYLAQQVTSHEEALAVHTSYANGGDTPQLQTAAKAALPFVQSHLDMVRTMVSGN